MASNKTYELMLKIGGQTDSSLKKACSTADKNLSALSDTAAKIGKAVAIGAVAVGTAVGTFAVQSVTAAAEYETQLANISTLLDGTASEIADRTAQIGDEVLTISNNLGVATSDLTDGMYQVISAFGDSEESAKILEIAAKSATAGNATTTDSINLLSAVTKGYNDTSAEAIEKASDLAFQTVKLGQTSFPELASSMGAVIPLASTMGVEQEALFGAMATLTGVTGSTSEVTTQLKAVMQAFLSPSTAMAESLNDMGYETGQALLESEGLQGALDVLMGSVGNNELAFADMFSSVEAQTAVLAMAGSQSENLTEKTAAMYEATGATNTAFEAQTDTLAYTIQEIKNLGSNFMTEFGMNILPYVKTFAEEAMPKVQEAMTIAGDYLVNTIIPAAQTAVQWVQQNADLLIFLGTAIGTAVIAYKAYQTAMVIYKAGMAVYQIVTAASATGTFTLAGAVAALNLPLYAAIAVIALLVAGGVLLYKNWDSIQEKVHELEQKMFSAWQNITVAVANAIESIPAKVASAFDSVSAVLTSTLDSISAGIANAIDNISAKFPLLGSALEGVWTSVQAIWENIRGIFTGVIDFIDNVFAGNWAGAWEAIVSVFGNVFGGIANIALVPINGVIGLLNGAIGAINGISIDVPDWVPGFGGQTYGFDIPQIPSVTVPALATGGIATAATLAMVGEGSEPEAILPLSKLADMLTSKDSPQDASDPPITFAPVFNFNGSTPSNEEAEQLARISFAEFKRLYEQMMAEKKRKQFA